MKHVQKEKHWSSSRPLWNTAGNSEMHRGRTTDICQINMIDQHKTGKKNVVSGVKCSSEIQQDHDTEKTIVQGNEVVVCDFSSSMMH